MKIRIKGNAIRLRLSRSEVACLHQSGYLEEHTVFAEHTFIYSLQVTAGSNGLSATFNGSKITVYIAAEFVKHWPVNNIVGCSNNQQLTATNSLYLLVEKDFICLDETTEDQSDQYENPNKNC